jgi:hypothetical protein
VGIFSFICGDVFVSDINILHDFDSPYLSGKYALRRGVQLVLYALSKKIRFFRKLTIVKEVYNETWSYAITLAKLSKIAGIQAIFGINRNLNLINPEISSELEKYGAKVIEHWHDILDGVSVSKWNPPITQRKKTWHYDIEFVCKGKKIFKLKPGEMAIFHVDYPYLLSHYINWLYYTLIEGGKIYS